MFHNNDWGMHMMWIFWLPIFILAIVFILALLRNNKFFDKQNKNMERESPLDILKRRYANGEISTEEFEERRNKLKSL
ncbi:SHOCT domain-containing protein [Lutibacter sp.]|uniref:SHOCT domain-containing protein n=1 Tax=Lutibacter sp. TaxID=1925666 RepID=UPI0035681E16